MNAAVPINIEIFNKITGYVLVDLYESFPNPKNIELQKIYDEVAVDIEDANLCKDIHMDFIANTFSFLAKEGFIEFNQETGTMHSLEVFYESVLTLKGMTLLGVIPDSIKSEQPSTYFDLLKESLKKESAKTISEVVKLLFVQAMGQITS